MSVVCNLTHTLIAYCGDFLQWPPDLEYALASVFHCFPLWEMMSLLKLEFNLITLIIFYCRNRSLAATYTTSVFIGISTYTISDVKSAGFVLGSFKTYNYVYEAVNSSGALEPGLSKIILYYLEMAVIMLL